MICNVICYIILLKKAHVLCDRTVFKNGVSKCYMLM
jgi:hypothetical protein